MGRYSDLFAQKGAQQQSSFVPFVVLGDPDFETSLEIITTLVRDGADALELGIPFSDPLADGPVIQNATLRAFKSGITVEKCFQMLKEIRKRHPEIPIGLLMYANLIYNAGIDEFYKRCAEVGVDSVLVADVPLHEYQPFGAACWKYGIDPILICPPDADEAIIQEIARQGQGYVYLVSRSGVTGESEKKKAPLTTLVDSLKAAKAPPVLQGFGISNADDARLCLQSGIDGVIVGSAITRIIEENTADKAQLMANIGAFVKEMTQVGK